MICHVIARCLALVVVAIGAISLFGILNEHMFIRTWVAEGTPMALPTAVAFIIIGVAVFVGARNGRST